MAQIFNPEDVQRIAQQMAATGNINPTGGAVGSKSKSPFEEQLAALALADKIKPDTSLGFLLGQILGQGLNAWSENYQERGRVKDKQREKNKRMNNFVGNRGTASNQNGMLAQAQIAQNLLGALGNNSALGKEIRDTRPEVNYPFEDLRRR